jgi:arsenite methyltransferase
VDNFAFDEKTSRKVEAMYTAHEVVAQRRAVLSALQLKAGERVLDIGSGPGFMTLEMAAVVGSEGRVHGIDPSESMLNLARNRCAEYPWAEFQSADALNLPFEDHSFDVAVSTQVYEYVADIPAALAELRRVLRPGGRALILDTDYGSLVIHTENEPRMARVLAAWDEHFVHAKLPRSLSSQLREAGFTIRHRSSIPMFNAEFEEGSYARGTLGMMASFAPGRQGVTKEEAGEWLAEFESLGSQGKFFFSLNRYLFLAERA